ncbi:MAG: DUF4340 domain-containing protein [candidate division FCPU426 bacterium]
MKVPSFLPPSWREVLNQPRAVLSLVLWIGAAGLTGGLAYYLLSPRAVTERHVRTFFSLKPDQVYGLELRGPKEHLVLRRSEEGWRMVAPVEDKVNTGTVFALLSDLCDWQTLRVVEDTEGQQEWEADRQGWRVTLRDQSGRAWTVQVGRRDAVSGRYYARRMDERKTYLVRMPEELLQSRWVSHLRDRNLFTEPLAGIRQLTFREAHAVMTLALESATPVSPELPRFGREPAARAAAGASGAEPRWAITYPFYVPTDPQVAAEVLSAVSQWEVEECVEESVGARTDLGKYGLTDPYAAVVVHQQDSRYPLELVFGQPRGAAGPTYVKSSREAKIFLLATGALERVQELLNRVASRRLIYFWDEVGQCEISTAHWRIALQRSQRGGWQAATTRKPNPDTELGKTSRAKPTEEPAPYFFKAGPLIQGLQALEYLDVVNDQNPYYAAYLQAVRVMQIRFYRTTGSQLEEFVFLEGTEPAGVFFLKKQSDNTVYMVSRRAVQMLLAAALPPKR